MTIPIGQISPLHFLNLILPVPFQSDLQYEYEVNAAINTLIADLGVAFDILAMKTDAAGNALVQFVGSPNQLTDVRNRHNTMFPGGSPATGTGNARN